ncbi:hypothetical protein ACFQZU_11720, partial [Streptomonospora algeriensis]
AGSCPKRGPRPPAEAHRCGRETALQAAIDRGGAADPVSSTVSRFLSGAVIAAAVVPAVRSRREHRTGEQVRLPGKR